MFYGDGGFYGDGAEGAFTTQAVAAGVIFAIKQGDTAPAIEDILIDANGNPVDLSGVSTIKFIMVDPLTLASYVDAAGEVTDAPAGKVRYQWAAGDTATTGGFRAEWEVTYSDGRIQTFPGDGWRKVRIYEDNN